MREFAEGLAIFAGLAAFVAALAACAFYEIGPCLFMLGLG